MHTFDAIILGSGHNSLILQAYLARAGLDTLCLEARDTTGGGLATVERPAGSGFWRWESVSRFTARYCMLFDQHAIGMPIACWDGVSSGDCSLTLASVRVSS